MSDAVLIALIGAISTVVVGLWNGRRIKEVHEEVRTANNLKLGEFADDAETRRVEKIPEGQRTAAEQTHIETVPPKS